LIRRLIGKHARVAFEQQFLRNDDHPAPIADEGMLVFKFLELHGGALTRGADQVREIFMGEFEREQYPARIFGAEFISDFEQRASKALAQSEPDEVRVPHQHRPPSPDSYIEHPAQSFTLYVEGGADEDLGLDDRDRAVGERVASKRPDRIGKQ